MSRPSEHQSSAPGRPVDPFELWRQIYETNERAWNAVLEQTVSSPAFAESSGKILETFLSAQKTVRENMRSYLEQINLPTREDIARLGELIVSLEEEVDQLDDRLGRVEHALTDAGSGSPPPTPASASVSKAATPDASARARTTPTSAPRRAARQSPKKAS
ncbi:MAG: poly(R)-hydroxyalkanoic acid synthase subunit PhaE [Chloroflexota bacterium]